MSLQQLLKDPDVEVRRFPDDVLKKLKGITNEVVAEMAEKDPAVRKIYASFKAFQDVAAENQRISEQAFLETREL